MVKKVRICVAAEASTDQKTTIVKIKTIQVLETGEVYIFPPELQPATKNHPKLIKQPSVGSAIKCLKHRGQQRNVYVSLSDELMPSYFDDDGNVCFHDVMLEEKVDSSKLAESPTSVIAQVEKPKSIHSIVKDFVLPKFNGTNGVNATTWINLFEGECKRMDISEIKYVETLRLFIEGPANNWFENNLLSLGLSESWNLWKISFLDTFARISWSDVTFAYIYRYISGSYVEYALKKSRLLLAVNPQIPESVQNDLVVVGLPTFVRSKLDRNILTSRDKLMAELTKIDPSNKVRTGTFTKTSTNTSPKGSEKTDQRPCSICGKRGKPGRNHNEKDCFFRDRVYNTNKNIKMVNNTELETELNNTVTQQKN